MILEKSLLEKLYVNKSDYMSIFIICHQKS